MKIKMIAYTLAALMLTAGVSAQPTFAETTKEELMKLVPEEGDFPKNISEFEGAVALDKAGIETTLVGKTLIYMERSGRHAKNIVAREFVPGGVMNSMNLTRGGSDTGTWTVQNDGTFCFRNGDNWRGKEDVCSRYHSYKGMALRESSSGSGSISWVGALK